MINKLKTLLAPILRKLASLHRNRSQEAPVESSVDALLEDDKTLVVEDREPSSSFGLDPEVETPEKPQENLTYLHKAKNWFLCFFRKGNKNQQAIDAEENHEATSIVIQQADIGDLRLDSENEDQEEMHSSGKLSRLKSKFIGWARRKIIWIPALASVLIGIGLTVTMMIHNRMSAQEQEFQNLKIQAKKLEQENQALKNSKKAIVLTEAKPPAPVATLPAVSRPTIETASLKNLHGGDCVISDKSSVRESLKSCIKAFNASGK